MRKASKTAVWNLAKEYNRRKFADHRGMVACVSCGAVKPYQEMDTGHWIPRTAGKAVYYEPDNLNPQCPGCNRFRVESGKIGYTLWMVRHYGQDRVDELQAMARQTVKIDLDYYRDLYTELLNELEAA